MIYFANPSSEKIRDEMRLGNLGFIDTPAQGNKRPEGIIWCADNGAYSDRWDESKWWRFLIKNAPLASTCAFATAPDVVGDHYATLERSRPWLPKIRALGYPVAFVVQDGATIENVPWDEFDVLFIGGAKTENPSDEWKMGPVARGLVAEAKRRGMWVHAGRVNSARRYHYMASIGADSADGTKLTHGPDVILPEVLSWVHKNRSQGTLFSLLGD